MMHAALTSLVTQRPDQLRHVAIQPARPGQPADWPDWTSPAVRKALIDSGIIRPWQHQVEVAELAHGGNHVVIATGTASGKSLAFWLPALSAVAEGLRAPDGRGSTVLYLAPTKALAHDQLRGLRDLDLAGLRIGVVDGDANPEERQWAKAHANVILSNPDLVHASLLPGHAQWAGFLRRLRYVVVDEAHAYRGLFGAHVGLVMRRLLRACEHYGSHPVVVAASATIADPGAFAQRLIGAPCEQVTDDGSPAPQRTIAFWVPAQLDAELVPPACGSGLTDHERRRSALTEAADLLASLAASGQQVIAFVRSRRGAEAVALIAQDRLAEMDPTLVPCVSAYRGGYLPEERRTLEAGLRAGTIRALASTSALELGIDISGLDAVLTVGWPGTRASVWQQFGRAGRRDAPALAMFLARDDPLDRYVVQHPDALLGTPVESIVIDPTNPVVLAPHLCAAAAEFPLSDEEAHRWFGNRSSDVLEDLGRQGRLRHRPTGWFWTSRERASELADLRGTGEPPVTIVEEGTGRILGSVDQASAHGHVHPGAVYTHLGATHLVTALDLQASIALAHRAEVDFTTQAQEISQIRIIDVVSSQRWGQGTLGLGQVDVTAQVVGYLRRRLLSGEVLSRESLDLPERRLTTTSVWWTLNQDQVLASGLDLADLPGAAHAAEHASIGLLPLFATCDRWDIGGVSTALHPDTGQVTVFVYDGASGGAGFAERGYHVARTWLSATRDLIQECPCPDGCPACIQSPKCGNGNDPLHKDGSIRLLDQLLAG